MMRQIVRASSGAETAPLPCPAPRGDVTLDKAIPKPGRQHNAALWKFCQHLGEWVVCPWGGICMVHHSVHYKGTAWWRWPPWRARSWADIRGIFKERYLIISWFVSWAASSLSASQDSKHCSRLCSLVSFNYFAIQRGWKYCRPHFINEATWVPRGDTTRLCMCCQSEHKRHS